ncbi:DUF2264 domain-containing protein [Pedobacter cryophilus]|uniref:DUF2264 domain-containing protein n=1 Tax=Pedobacter cryophilus TaxID=2571271 RepID=A0A4U1BY39_9SPHI|nr:DUF2264 domain-containing protein [Pedobacter cryophilus]TKB97926.1 DUF2264 domain-containing protein [Pedobacter cryophilus]
MKKIFSLIILFLLTFNVNAQDLDNPAAQRAYMVQTMLRIADPVLSALSKGELRKTMPIEAKTSNAVKYTHLEAFGRTLAGISPWLALGVDESPEGKLRKKYIEMSQLALKNATDKTSPDFLNFNKDGGQPLVDAAFLAQALLRAPNQLWKPLDEQTKNNVIAALKSTRVIKPGESNWLLFSAMVEAALLKFDGTYDKTRVDYAIKQHLIWYKGDGAYGDGANFHWDYYNSFVIQPMFLEVLKTLKEEGINDFEDNGLALKRAIRYAEVQERLIASDGTYPPIGRSLAYRFGAFQLLSKIALMGVLSKYIQPQQVRYALYTMVKKQVEAPNTFDKNGWLTIGFYGHQPEVGESYISTGSLYLCTQVFLILGLPDTDPFWVAPNEDWTARKIWNGKTTLIDKALKDN